MTLERSDVNQKLNNLEFDLAKLHLPDLSWKQISEMAQRIRVFVLMGIEAEVDLPKIWETFDCNGRGEGTAITPAGKVYSVTRDPGTGNIIRMTQLRQSRKRSCELNYFV